MLLVGVSNCTRHMLLHPVHMRHDGYQNHHGDLGLHVSNSNMDQLSVQKTHRLIHDGRKALSFAVLPTCDGRKLGHLILERFGLFDRGRKIAKDSSQPQSSDADVTPT